MDTAKSALQQAVDLIPGAPGSAPPTVEEPTEPKDPLPPKKEQATPRPARRPAPRPARRRSPSPSRAPSSPRPTVPGCATPTTRSRRARAARRCCRTTTCARRSPTSTTSGSRSGWCTPAGPARTASFDGYGTASEVTLAGFLEKGKKTDVFVRFSTVLGTRGSADTVRDTRGFATKFYTDEGTFDLVGNNIPVFFIQDGIKFPDIIHAGKPHPDREIPQAQSAHDTFWDFVSLHTEAQHHTIWNMSDRGIPRSYRMMEGFGVHTFRLVNADGDDRAGEVPLEAEARRALPDLGGGAAARRPRPRLPPPRPVRRDRGRRVPGVGAGHPGHPGHPGGDLRGHRPARPDEDRAGGARPGAADRQADPEQGALQLLRRDRAGRLPRRPPAAGHRRDQRPAAADPAVLLRRHPAHPARRAELHPDPDQPSARPGERHAPRRLPPARGARRRRAVQAELARRRQPVLRGRRGRRLPRRPGQGRRGHQGARQPRVLRRPLQPGAAVLAQHVAGREGAHHPRVHLRARQVLRAGHQGAAAPGLANIDPVLCSEVATGLGLPAPEPTVPLADRRRRARRCRRSAASGHRTAGWSAS